MPQSEAKPIAEFSPKRGESICAIAQRAATLLGCPRKCLAPACRRARRCVGAETGCLRDETRSLPVRVFARHVAAGRRLLQDGAAGARRSDGSGAAKPQRTMRKPHLETAIPMMQVLLYCLGKSAGRPPQRERAAPE